MSDKKRKASSKDAQQPRKKPQNAATVKVRHRSGPDVAKPAIANCPGSSIPSSLKFTSYSDNANSRDSHLLLHSSDHNTIDFTAEETRVTSTTESHLKHYVAIYDPSTSELVVTEAKRVAARSRVRQSEADKDSDDDAPPPTPAGYAGRAALTEAFGTKKSKKAAQAMAENRLLANGEDDDEDPLSQALHSTVQDDDDPLPVSSEPQQSNKPLPQANLDATDIRQVYPLSSLVFPSPEALDSLPIAYWEDRMSSDKQISSSFRFISNRVKPLFTHRDTSLPSTTQPIHLLRYTLLLLEIHKFIARQNPKKPIPDLHNWPEGTLTTNTPTWITKSTLNTIFPQRRPTPYSITLLRATILALALHIPPYGKTPSNTNSLILDLTDLIMDLGVERADLQKLCRELGCKIDVLTDNELAAWGMARQETVDENGKKVKKANVKFARLRFPVEFPKMSRGKRVERGRR